MTFHGVQNDGRVRKIVDTLDLISKSAKSNRVGSDDEYAMLKPVFDKLGEFGWHLKDSLVPEQDSPTSERPRSQPQWFTVRQMAQEASLQDLTYAMAVYLNRIDEELKRKVT